MEEIVEKWSETDPMLEATCVFECGELRQAITKIIKYGEDDERLESLAEECGDVLICIDALMKKYGLEKAIEKWQIQKLERLDERMKVKSDGKSAGYHKCINCNYYNEYHNNNVCLKICIKLDPEVVECDNICRFWKLKGGK